MRQIQARNRALTVKLMSILHFHCHSMHELTWRASRQPVCGKRIAAKMPQPRAYSGRGAQACADCISRAMLRSMACISAIFCRAKPYSECASSAILRRSRPCSHAQSFAAQSHIHYAHDARYQRAPTCPDRRRTICFPFCSRCCNAPPPLRIVCRMEVSRFATGIQTYS